MKLYTLSKILLVATFFLGFQSIQAQNDTLILQPGPADGMDAEIRTDLPSQNMGSHFDFIANAWTAQGNFFVQRSLIRFDLTAIPAGSVVQEAILDLYTNLNSGHYQLDSGQNASYFMRVLETWQETTVTWNNQPQATLSDAVVVPQSTSNTQTYHLDLTRHIQEMVDNPETNHGWLFRLQTEETYRCLAFSTSDHSQTGWRPRLTVIYSTCDPPEAHFAAQVNSFTVAFTDHSTLAESWQWHFGDGHTSTLQDPVHTYAGAGTYQVCLQAANTCGTDISCTQVQISCSLPVAGFYYESGYPYVAFYDTSFSATTVLSRLWDFGDGDTSSVMNPLHEFSAPGTYTVCLSVTDSCGQQTHCEPVEFFLPMMVNFEEMPSNTDGLYVEFTDLTPGSTWWNWTFGDGAGSTLQNPSHYYLKPGAYEVCLECGNASERGFRCDSIYLSASPDNPESLKITVFPNPAGNLISLQGELFLSSLAVLLTDMQGKQVAVYTFRNVKPGQPIPISLSGFTKGKYFLSISSEKNRQVTPLIID